MRIVHKNYIYEPISLQEMYSHDNKAFLNYMRDDSVDFTNSDVADVFEKWLESNGYEDQYKEFYDDYFDAYALAEKYPAIADEFSEWLPDNHDELMRMGSGYTKAHMDLSNKNLLPRTTWLIHFSDSAHKIAVEGFKKGASDVGEVGLTRGGDGYPGYNFAFLANRIHDSEKYGDDAVIFQSSGVHVFHYGDDENQVVFYGPDVKELIYLRRYKDGDLNNDHSNSPDYEYAIMSNKNISEPVRKFKDVEDAISFIKTNYRQYANKIAHKVK